MTTLFALAHLTGLSCAWHLFDRLVPIGVSFPKHKRPSSSSSAGACRDFWLLNAPSQGKIHSIYGLPPPGGPQLLLQTGV